MNAKQVITWYRVQWSTGTGWLTEWHDTRRSALDDARKLLILGYRVQCDRFECRSITAADLVFFLNHSDVHRLNFEGYASSPVRVSLDNLTT